MTVGFYFQSSSTHEYGELTDGVRQSLEGIVGKSNVSTSLSVREHHGKDESYHPCVPPEAVVFPASVEEVSRVARLCNAERIPVIPFGTGTGLEGGVGAVMVSVTIIYLHHLAAFPGSHQTGNEATKLVSK